MAHLTFEIIENNQFSSDQKKFKTVEGTHHEPWASTEEMLAAITTFRRHLGQEFEIIDGDGISTYHFVGGIEDEDLVKESSSSDGGTGENFANTDLTATGDRIHDFEGYAATIKGLSAFNLQGTSSLQTITYDDSDDSLDYFVRGTDGGNDLLYLRESINTDDSTIQVTLNVDGVNSIVTFTKGVDGDENIVYSASPTSGSSVTCVSYQVNIIGPIIFEAEVEETNIGISDDPKKLFAIFDGKEIKKIPISYLDSTKVNSIKLSNGINLNSDQNSPGALYLIEGFNIYGSQSGSGGVSLEVEFTISGIDVRTIDPSSAYTSATINLNVTSPITGNTCMLIVGQGTIAVGSTVITSITSISTSVGIIMDNAAPASAKAGDIFEWTFIKTTEVGDNGVWHRTK